MRVWASVWLGSTVICRAVAVWIAGGAFARLLVLGLAAGFIKGLPHSWDIVVVLAAAWVVTAVVLGLREPWPPAAPENEEPAPAEGEPTPPPVSRRELAIALHAVADPHAHLSAVARRMGTSTDRVREALKAADIPISGGVRMGGAVSTGVKAADFPPLPSPDGGSPDGVVGAGQNSNNNARAFETEPDEERPQRTLVRWLNKAK